MPIKTKTLAALFVFPVLLAVCPADALRAAAPNYSGLVTDAGGQPLAEVEVFFLAEVAKSEHEWQSTRSGPQGEFTLPPTLPEFDPKYPDWFPIFAFRPGWAIQGRIDADHDQRRIRIELARPVPSTLRVVSPQGEPVAGASVICTYVHPPSTWSSLPESLQRTLTFKTDAAGVVRLACSTPEQKLSWEVITDRFGHQQPETLAADDGGWELRLAEVGRVVGQVTAADPQAVRNLNVSLGLGPDLDLRTDEHGRFEVPAYPVGELWVSVDVEPLFPYRQPDLIFAELKAHETLEIKIELQRGFRAKGRVVDASTGKPLAGAFVAPSGPGFNDECETDANGEYEFVALPGEFDFYVHPPAGYFPPADSPVVELRPTGTPTIVDAIQLQRGLTLRGAVVNENGLPVGAAEVTAAWLSADQRRNLRTSSATTNAQGKFVLSMIEPGAALHVAAASKSAGSVELQTVDADQAAELVLRVQPDGVRPLAGRVVDSQERPLAGIEIQLVRRVPFPRQTAEEALLQPFYDGTSDVDLAGAPHLLTDDRGIFRSPHPLSILSAYAVKIAGGGVFPRQTNVSNPEPREDGAAWLPETVASPVTTLSGRVVDHDGQPLAAAQVFAHSAQPFPDYVTAETDDAGNFLLESVHGEARFLFASKEGFRFGGTVLREGPQVVTLVSRAAAVAPAERRQAKAWTADRRRELVGQFREPLLGILALSHDDTALRVAMYRPDIVEEALRAEPSNAPVMRAAVLLAHGDLDEAVTVLLATDPADAYLGAHEWLLRAADQAAGLEKKLDILKQASRRTRAIKLPLGRLRALASTVDRLVAWEQEPLAKLVVKEGIEVAGMIPLPQRQESVMTWFEVVASLAAVDLPAALELTTGMEAEPLLRGTWALIAEQIAARDPAEAERLFGMERKYSRSGLLPVVCQRMASTDLPRALRMIEAEPNENARADAMGRVALQLATSQPEKARELLRAAVTRPASSFGNDTVTFFGADVESNVGGDETLLGGGGFGGPRLDDGGSVNRWEFQTLARLVHIAETVDPDAVGEYIWRAVMRHPGPRTEGLGRDPALRRFDVDGQTAKLAAFIALYDLAPAVARDLTAPVFARAATYDLDSLDRVTQSRAVLLPLGLADPERAAGLLQTELLRPNPKFTFDQEAVVDAWIKLYTANERDFWELVLNDALR